MNNEGIVVFYHTIFLEKFVNSGIGEIKARATKKLSVWTEKVTEALYSKTIGSRIDH